MKGMTTCKICGRDFPLIAEEHYVARDSEKKGVIPALSGQEEATQYDAFNCPHCGCQNVMQERKFALEATVFTEDEDEDEIKMRQYLIDYCENRTCHNCPLDKDGFKCGRGHSFGSEVGSRGYMTPTEIKAHYDAVKADKNLTEEEK